MERLLDLVNIGPSVEAQLMSVGISTEAELKSIGSKAAWLRIKAIDDSACLNRLCALEGAIQGIRWHQLTQQDKQALREFYNQYK